MKSMKNVSVIVSLVFAGALFGSFYDWMRSSMIGLDQADPRVAIAAMQAINGSDKNIIFAPVFFGTPPFVALSAALLYRANDRASAFLLAVGTAIILVFGILVTFVFVVPLNETLAAISEPLSVEEAAGIWQDYSERWQFWNHFRTLATGLSLMLIAWGAVIFDSD